jgi:tetratricopeptide (TPR) repeat protein
MKSAYWWILVGAAAVFLAAGAAAVVYFLSPRESAWTTRSKAALEELERGIDATQRGYRRAAVEHLERALELDPRFVAPRLFLARLYAPWRPEPGEIAAELGNADLADLNPRERLLVRTLLAASRGEENEAEAALDALLTEYPDDFLGLDLRCERTWRAEDWDAAQACYEKLAALHTNYVEAYNRLGHVDMARGRFTEAEVHFRTHLFIAPDQAAPHTALAELLILLGRYDEARALLGEALEIEPDSCRAHVQLMRVSNFSRRFADARRVIDHLETIEECSVFADDGFFCYARGWVDFLAGDFAGSWARFDPECLERRGGFDLIGHHAAIAAGRPEAAAGLRERLRRRLAEAGVRESAWDFDWLSSLDAHFQGVERLSAGDYRAASGFLREADERLRYWTRERAGFKLLNRTFLARSLELEGKREEAEAILAEVAAVNPRYREYLPAIPFLESRRIRAPARPGR